MTIVFLLCFYLFSLSWKKNLKQTWTKHLKLKWMISAIEFTQIWSVVILSTAVGRKAHTKKHYPTRQKHFTKLENKTTLKT